MFWIKTIGTKVLVTEATKAVIALAFEQLGMNKLITVHDKDNPASGRVMAKSGMKYSQRGALRDARPAWRRANGNESSLCPHKGRIFGRKMSQDIDNKDLSPWYSRWGTAGLTQSVERIHGKDEGRRFNPGN